MADWLLFDFDPLTQRKKYMKLEDGLMHIRETMPVDAVLEANKRDVSRPIPRPASLVSAR
jgi:hypothetical protein